MWSFRTRTARTHVLPVLIGITIILVLLFNFYYVVDRGGFRSLTSALPPPEDGHKFPPAHAPEPTLDSEIELVVASLTNQNASWLSIYFPTWKRNIYIVDDPNAPLTVPQNKGHESMVYLT
jgi:hypothetical protein